MDYELLTTTRYDPLLSLLPWNDDAQGPSPYFLLPYHYERLQAAARHHGWTSAVNHTYQQFKSTVSRVVSREAQPAPAFRVRILLSKTGEIQATAAALEASFADDPFLLPTYADLAQFKEAPLEIYIDKEPTIPSTFTKTKTTLRKTYDDARLRNGLPPLATPAGKMTEVLLHNEGGFVMETSIFNIAFRRGSRWLTPSSGTGCLPGVVRRWLVEHGRIDEDSDGILDIATIATGELVLLFNGAQGCRLGKIVVP